MARDTPDLKPRRWRVVLVRLPQTTPTTLLNQDITADSLPRVVRTTNDLAQASDTVNRLRAEGAVAFVMEDPVDNAVFCSQHPTLLATQYCRVCQNPICITCRHQANDLLLCHKHSGVAHNRVRFVRMRQLFVLFLFAVFLYEVLDFTQADKQRISAQGSVDVVLFQYITPGTQPSALIDTLNDPDSPYNLDQIRQWFNEERRRYGGTQDDYLRFTVLPLRTLPTTPPTLLFADDNPLKIAWASWQYLRFFRRLTRQQGIAREDFGARVFVLYGSNSADAAAHSRGSEQGRLAVSHIDLQERNPTYALTTIAHELGHVLGAEDTYDPTTFLAQHPEGFVEPFADPLYPQRFAELMAVDIPVSSTLEVEIKRLSQVRVGYQTAAQMNWISQGEAQAYYTPPADRPADRLPPRPMPTTPTTTP